MSPVIWVVVVVRRRSSQLPVLSDSTGVLRTGRESARRTCSLHSRSIRAPRNIMPTYPHSRFKRVCLLGQRRAKR
ncbi:hypothetical protein DFH09DRAFT_1143697 [Mycena vulgaris]|nr:hypothetical protein DFH09DRAFT_1143697 [Mycena vulgaris]